MRLTSGCCSGDTCSRVHTRAFREPAHPRTAPPFNLPLSHHLSSETAPSRDLCRPTFGLNEMSAPAGNTQRHDGDTVVVVLAAAAAVTRRRQECSAMYGCDDGNAAEGDGCSDTCSVEAGFSCWGGAGDSRDTCLCTRRRALAYAACCACASSARAPRAYA
jgi:cysteine-rich repeat protein